MWNALASSYIAINFIFNFSMKSIARSLFLSKRWAFLLTYLCYPLHACFYIYIYILITEHIQLLQLSKINSRIQISIVNKYILHNTRCETHQNLIRTTATEFDLNKTVKCVTITELYFVCSTDSSLTSVAAKKISSFFSAMIVFTIQYFIMLSLCDGTFVVHSNI